MLIFFLVGQSNTGKNTVMKEILNRLSLERYVSCTTRPIRDGKVDGREYNFYDEVQEGAIEVRHYDATWGRCSYFTMPLKSGGNYIIAGSLEMCMSILAYYGRDIVKPIYIKVGDRERLMRGILREDKNKGNYKEVARRFYDEFSEYTDDMLKLLAPSLVVENTDLEACVSGVENFIRRYL